MKISYNWLKRYIDADLPSPQELEQIFTFKLCEVEGIETTADGDGILDLNILPNRAHDLLSHYGIAKELAGILKLPFKDPNQYVLPETVPTNLKVDAECSRRYMGRIVRNIKVAPSPDWMVKQLEGIGQRSINNIVDATNLVMYDCGQPCHAFDLGKVSGGIITRPAKDGETMTTLDGKTVTLIPDDFVIADEEGILALAGVKGGTKAEVDADTTDIVLEVANFFPVRVRRTARRLGILTDAAKRFENELSPELCEFAMMKLTSLIAKLCPEAVFEDVVDEYPFDTFRKLDDITFSIAWINAQLGTNLQQDEMVNILSDYGYEISGDGDVRILHVPALRLDLKGPHDLCEEVLRLYGLENVQPVALSLSAKPAINEIMYCTLAARKKLVADGYHEVMTYSFRKKGEFEVARGVGDKGALRKNLTDGIKEAFEMNKLNAPIMGMNEVKIFEIGSVFPKDGEIIHIAIADKKGITEMTLDEWSQQNGIVVGDSYAEVLPEKTNTEKPFTVWSQYPFMVRDIALWVPESVTADEVKAIIDTKKGDLVVRGPELFDTFTKDGRTSYAFRLVFQSFNKTLTDTDVQPVTDAIYKALKVIPEAEIR